MKAGDPLTPTMILALNQAHGLHVQIAELRGALAGLMGLIQLACHNPDMREPLRSNLQTNHRFVEARAALAAAESQGGVRP